MCHHIAQVVCRAGCSVALSIGNAEGVDGGGLGNCMGTYTYSQCPNSWLLVATAGGGQLFDMTSVAWHWPLGLGPPPQLVARKLHRRI